MHYRRIMTMRAKRASMKSKLIQLYYNTAVKIKS